MKRFQILLLTLLLVFAVPEVSLAVEDNPTVSPAGLSQYNDYPGNLSSSHPSIVNEESADQDKAVQDETAGSDLADESSVSAEPAKPILEENLTETPEHYSGPMNADLRGQQNAEDTPVAEEPAGDAEATTDSSPTVEPAKEAPVNAAPQADASSPDVEAMPATPDQTASPGAPEETSTDLPEESTGDAANAKTGTAKEPASSTVEVTPAPLASEQESATPAAKVIQKDTGSAPAPGADALPETGPADQMQAHTARNKPAAPAVDTTDQSTSDESTGDDTTPSSSDQLAAKQGLVPKVGFLLKEFSKWLADLINTVDSIL